MNFRTLLVRIQGTDSNHRIRFSNGYSISIQCSKTAYSNPRFDGLPLDQYIEFEVAVFNATNEYITSPILCEAAGIELNGDDVFSWVPEANVQKMFEVVVSAEEGSLENEPVEITF